MKKSILFSLFVFLLGLVACQRDMIPVSESTTGSKLVPKTFSVSVLETKTYLEGYKIKWSEGDVINVIGVNPGGDVNQHPFTLKTGDGGKTSGTFEGSVNEDEVTFYAIYPNYAIDVDKIADGIILTSSNQIPVSGDNMQQKGYADGFDPDFGILVATADASGNMAFQHVMSFFKIKIGVDNVAKITMSTTGDLRFGARVQYTLSTGAIDVQSAKKTVEITPAVGSSFVNGSSYLVAFPPRTDKKIKQLTLTYTSTDDISSSLEVNDSNFKNLVCEPGKIYNLGCPPISFTPVIVPVAPSKLAYDATGGSFTYSITNTPSTAVASASLQSGITWISNVAVNGNTVTFVCETNTGADERSATITLSYSGAADVPVTITQGVAGGSSSESHTRIYYNKTNELLDGTTVTENNYFTHTTGYVDFSATANNGGGINSFTIPGTTFNATSGLKLDSSGSCKFTTSSSLNSSVTFYYTKRKSGTGKIQITPTGGTATVYEDAEYGTVNNKTVSLEKDTEYTIARNDGELLLVAVVVNESSN